MLNAYSPGLGGRARVQRVCSSLGGGLRFAVSWRRITPDAFVWRALAHARVGEVERVHFAMEFVGHAVLVAIDDEAGARRRAILRRT